MSWIVHCSMLAEDAIKSAIRDYKSKRQNVTPTLGPDATVGEVAVWREKKKIWKTKPKLYSAYGAKQAMDYTNCEQIW